SHKADRDLLKNFRQVDWQTANCVPSQMARWRDRQNGSSGLAWLLRRSELFAQFQNVEERVLGLVDLRRLPMLRRLQSPLLRPELQMASMHEQHHQAIWCVHWQ